MKKLFLTLLTGLMLAQCGPKKLAHRVAVIQKGLVFQAGQATPQGMVQVGDSVEVLLPILSKNNAAEVILRDGKRGFVPLSCLALPVSLKTSADKYP